MTGPSVAAVASGALDDLRACFSGRLVDPAAPGAETDLESFVVDWRKVWRGSVRAVVQPDTPADVAAVVTWCAANGVPIVPQGGNTGLSGGATPDASGTSIVLSLTRLCRIRDVDPVNNTITVDAGCTLEAVQDAAAAAGRYFPLSLAAEGSCTIGGNLATNAGGTAVLRYGTARELCLGLEAVTAAGELWDGLRALRKDNTGYDLRDVFIGSEGTLGVITGAVLKLFPRPAARVCAFVAVPSPADALSLFGLARARLDTAVTGFELLSGLCLDLVLTHMPSCRSPLSSASPWYVLIELSDARSEAAARDDLESLLGAALDSGWASDAAIAESAAQTAAFWALRENVSEAQGAEGPTIKHDVAVPISSVDAFVCEANAAVSARFPAYRFVTFGHLGDGNLHYNFSPPPGASVSVIEEFKGSQETLNEIVHDLVRVHRGSISAEHGLGVLRRDEADRFRSDVDRRLQLALKAAFDPSGILNPGKMLPG